MQVAVCIQGAASGSFERPTTLNHNFYLFGWWLDSHMTHASIRHPPAVTTVGLHFFHY